VVCFAAFMFKFMMNIFRFERLGHLNSHLKGFQLAAAYYIAQAFWPGL
jgi:hypothetical protein